MQHIVPIDPDTVEDDVGVTTDGNRPCCTIIYDVLEKLEERPGGMRSKR